jgi:hypothetical protein
LNGLALARAAQRKNPKLRVLFIDLPETKIQVGDLGAFLSLPVAMSDLLDSVKFLLPLAGC